MTLTSEKGMTLVEVLISFVLFLVLFLSLIASTLAVKSVRSMSLHRIQAVNVARGEVERLKGLAFDAIADDETELSYDAGVDGLFDTADDRTGVSTVTLGDFLDMDADGDTAETWIDIDGDGTNDEVARPVRVEFTWDERIAGQSQEFSVVIDTLIAP